MFKQFIKLNFLGLMMFGTVAYAQISNRPSDNLVRSVLSQSGEELTLTNDDLSYEVTDFYTNIH